MQPSSQNGRTLTYDLHVHAYVNFCAATHDHSLTLILGVNAGPRRSTLAQSFMHAQLQAGLPRFGQSWPQLGDHDFLCAPTKFCTAITKFWVPTQSFARPRRASLCATTHAHEVSCSATHTFELARSFMGAHPCRVDVRSEALLGHPHENFARPCCGSIGRPKTTSLGLPNMGPISRILGHHNIAAGAPRHRTPTPTLLAGSPRNLMGAQQSAVLGTHEVLWKSTQFTCAPTTFRGLSHTIRGRA